MTRLIPRDAWGHPLDEPVGPGQHLPRPWRPRREPTYRQSYIDAVWYELPVPPRSAHAIRGVWLGGSVAFVWCSCSPWGSIRADAWLTEHFTGPIDDGAAALRDWIASKVDRGPAVVLTGPWGGAA